MTDKQEQPIIPPRQYKQGDWLYERKPSGIHKVQIVGFSMKEIQVDDNGTVYWMSRQEADSLHHQSKEPPQPPASEGADEWLSEDDYRSYHNDDERLNLIIWEHLDQRMLAKYGPPSDHIGKAAEARVVDRTGIKWAKLLQDKLDEFTTESQQQLGALRDQLATKDALLESETKWANQYHDEAEAKDALLREVYDAVEIALYWTPKTVGVLVGQTSPNPQWDRLKYIKAKLEESE